MAYMEKIIVFGPSCSGKSTLVDSIRCNVVVDVPKRFITRSSRLNDNTTENLHVTNREFSDGVKLGTIVLPWERNLGEVSGTVWYGFAPVVHEIGRLTVYSANNAFMSSYSGQTLLEEGAWPVMVYSEPNVRSERMHGRSPDLSITEVQKRLSDEPTDLLAIPGLVIVENPQGSDFAIRKLNHLVGRILEDKITVGQYGE
jgi:ribose 1,5-bisphosphokinase PhnN